MIENYLVEYAGKAGDEVLILFAVGTRNDQITIAIS